MKHAQCLVNLNADSAVSPAVRSLSPWFHNLHLPDGTQTAPAHSLGDFPRCKWKQIARSLPKDLTGWSVLDIGCNAGFYAIELAKRGAQVTGIDREPHFLKQAKWAVEQFELQKSIELRQMDVYALAHWRRQFDLVLFMGVFYHLRYPLLGLDIVAEKVRRLLLFQTLTMPGEKIFPAQDDYPLAKRQVMLKDGWPKMAFIEKSLAGDPSNWWSPNHAGALAMLRSAGMTKIRRLSHEIYLCSPTDKAADLSSPVQSELRIVTNRANRR